MTEKYPLKATLPTVPPLSSPSKRHNSPLIFSRAVFSSLDTCAWDMPISAETSVWVFPGKNVRLKSSSCSVSFYSFGNGDVGYPVFVIIVFVAYLVHNVQAVPVF